MGKGMFRLFKYSKPAISSYSSYKSYSSDSARGKQKRSSNDNPRRREPREEEDANVPKIHTFATDLANWLSFVSILMFIIYGILYLVYEVALNLAHVRWAFVAYLAFCLIDVIAYWLCRYAVEDTSGEGSCFLYLVLTLQTAACLFYTITPIIILNTYNFVAVVSARNDDAQSKQLKGISLSEEEMKFTLEDYVKSDPCSDDRRRELWECDYIRSIEIAAWCMLISAACKLLMIFVVYRILKKSKK